MKNTIEDLRNHLFQKLEELNDDEAMKNPEIKERTLETAKAVAELGTVIVNSAKVEVQYLATVGGTGTGFIKKDKQLSEGEKK